MADESVDIGPNLTGILNTILINNHQQLTEALNNIMANQAEFDAKITQANTALDEIAAAVAAETAQIQAFIDANPSVNTSALDGVVSRLEGVNESVAGVFEPTAPAEPTEPEVEPPPPAEPEA